MSKGLAVNEEYKTLQADLKHDMPKHLTTYYTQQNFELLGCSLFNRVLLHTTVAKLYVTIFNTSLHTHHSLFDYLIMTQCDTI